MVIAISNAESKLLLLAAGQASKWREELLGQGTVTLFTKPADQEDGGLMSQRTVLPELFQASFMLKGEGVKPNTSWFRSASRGYMLISSFL